MPRPSTLPVGSIRSIWKILEKSDYKSTGKNQTVKLECIICNTVRTTWLSNLRQNKARCSTCDSKSKSLNKALFHDGTTVAVYPDRVEIILGSTDLPTDATLYRMVSDEMGFRLTDDFLKPKVKPDPDFGYEASLAVPWDYIDFYCDEVDLDTEASIKAMDLYNSLVEQPRNLQSKHFKGSRSSWVEDGIKMGYIYWKDSKTWPRKPPETLEAPTGALSAESASNVDPAPLVDL